MLTFFRRIRKGLLGDGSTSKYLLYAIGEIVLVGVGILLALQVNNWNEGRKDRIQEREILGNLHEVLDKDLTFMQTSTSFHKSVKNSIKILLNSLENHPGYHDSLSFHFWNISSIWALPITESVFETLKSKGIELISNESLRNSIIEFYDTDTPLFQRDQENYFGVLDYASKNIFNTRFDSFWASNYDDISDTNKWNEQFITEQMVGSMKPLNFEELKADIEFKYFLKTLSNRYQAHIQMPSDKMTFKIRRLLEMIEEELRIKN